MMFWLVFSLLNLAIAVSFWPSWVSVVELLLGVCGLLMLASEIQTGKHWTRSVHRGDWTFRITRNVEMAHLAGRQRISLKRWRDDFLGEYTTLRLGNIWFDLDRVFPYPERPKRLSIRLARHRKGEEFCLAYYRHYHVGPAIIWTNETN